MERARRFATGAPAVATTGVKRLPTDDASTDDNPLTSLVSPPKMIKTMDAGHTKPVSLLMTSVPVDVRAGGDDAIASEYERKLEEQRRMREEVKRKKEERRLMRAHTLKEQPALTSTVTSLLRAPAAEVAPISACESTRASLTVNYYSTFFKFSFICELVKHANRANNHNSRSINPTSRVGSDVIVEDCSEASSASVSAACAIITPTSTSTCQPGATSSAADVKREENQAHTKASADAVRPIPGRVL